MLSIAPVASLGYYDKLDQEDYYRDHGNGPTRWLGGGAQTLGLNGSVGSKDFRAIFDGFDRNGVPLIKNAGCVKRRPGWDLTFSTPKSVSVLWAIGNDSVRERIENCHNQAVLAALEFLERHAGWSRKGHAGRIWQKAQLTFATFRHGTSRSLDPNLHTHCLAANIAVCEDGRIRAVHSKPLYAWKMTIGAIYRVALSYALQKDLGLTVKQVKESFELEGVPAALCSKFSQRSQQIRAEMERRGWASARAAAYAALETRQAKEERPAHLLHAAWREISSRLGMSPEVAGQLVGQSRRQSPAFVDLAKVIDGVIGRLHQSQSHFTKREVLRDAAYKVMASGLSSEQLVTEVEQHLHRSHDIIHLGEIYGEKRYATRQVVEVEADLLAKCDQLHATKTLAVPAKIVAKSLRRFPEITKRPEQAAAVEYLVGDGNLKLLSGMPGTGKTYVLDAARDAWERSGYRVFGAALAGRAARELESKAHINSETICKLLQDLDATPLDALKHHARQMVRAARGLPTYRRQPIRLDDRTVVVIDEAAMNGTVETQRIVKRVLEAGAKLVLVGDPQQLSPIDAGGPFRALLSRFPAARLDRIERQSDPRDVEAIHDLARGDVRKALHNYEKRGLIHVGRDRRRAIERLVAEWTERGGVRDPSSHAILVATNADRLLINAKCQAARAHGRQLDAESFVTIRRQETLEGQHTCVVREDLHVGDRVMCLERSRRFQVENGDIGVITGFDRDSSTLAIRLDGEGQRPRTVHIPIAKYQALTLGYAATTHKFQGATVPHAYALLGGSMQSLELTFTQLSRAKHSTRLYADRLDAGENLQRLVAQIERSQAKLMAHDLLDQSSLRPDRNPPLAWREPEERPAKPLIQLAPEYRM